MSYRVVLSAGFALICIAGSSHAGPLNTPELVYIDGVPCNRPCQDYMKWSRDTLAATSSQYRPSPVTRHVTETSRAQSQSATTRKHLAKRVAPHETLRGKAGAPIRAAATSSTVAPTKTNPAKPVESPTVKPADIPSIPQTESRTTMSSAPEAELTGKQRDAPSVAPAGPSTPTSEPPPTSVATAPPAAEQTPAPAASIEHADAPASAPKLPEDDNRSAEQRTEAVASTAEQLTEAASEATTPNASKPQFPDSKSEASSVTPNPSNPTSETPETAVAEAPSAGKTPAPSIEHAETTVIAPKPSEDDIGSPQQKIAEAVSTVERLTEATSQRTQGTAADHDNQGETSGDKTASISTATDSLIAVLVSRPEINAVSDLAGKSVAIDNGLPSESNVRTALVAAGAPGVELSAGSSMAVDRLVKGEVPAAVVELVSPDAAAAFPDIRGYKVFRIPLSPRSMETQKETR